MLKYRLKKIPKKKIIIWSTMLLVFVISLGSMVGFYAAGNPFPGSSTSLIQGDTVIVNNLTADWNYYMGLNYTEVTNKNALPGTSADKTSAVSNGKYGINTLVAVQINYNGADINESSKVGFISSDSNEQQSKLTYYKYVPIVNGKVKIDLIDNPYSQRPTDRGFNGWVCDDSAATNSVACEDMTFSYDDDFYLRYLTVNAPSADANGDKKLVINLKASWIMADVKTSINDIDDFSKKTMEKIKGTPIYKLDNIYEKKYEFKSDVIYYEHSIVPNRGNMNHCENRNRDTRNNRCAVGGGCNCYVSIKDNSSPVDTNKTYYIWAYAREEGSWLNTSYVDYYREATDDDFNITVTDKVIGQDYVVVGYDWSYKNNDLLVGYYYKVDNYDNSNRDLYYNANGISCSKINCGTIAYKLIQYSDADEIKRWSVTTNEDGTETINTDYDNYYFLVTRDTNILDLPNGNYNISNFSNKEFPFTITGSYDGSQNDVSRIILTMNSTLNVREDLVIDNIVMNGPAWDNYSNDGVNNSVTANYQNVKIGRKVYAPNNRLTASAVVGGGTEYGNDISGSVVTEAGAYRIMIALGNTSKSDERVIFQMGNDYDKVIGDDSNLSVTYQAVSSISGNHDSTNIIPVSHMIVKSGKIGSYMIDYEGYIDSNSYYSGKYYMYGIYVGARSGGSSNGFRTLKVEGGQIFSINGGPCIKTYYYGNVIGTYVTGGTIHNIVGGAGVSETYGNRIISVTGGTVINAVAGGSNSYTGNSSPGPMNGETLVYVGGNATIGGTLQQYDNNRNMTLYGIEEPGSVFGAGLGQNGSTTRGVVKNSHVIIDQSATINGSVYGGGNYGATGTDYDEKTYSLVDILGARVKGSVYGASNQNGAGYTTTSSTLFHTITMNMYNGTIEKSLYGGSNIKGQVYGNVNINLYKGNVSSANNGVYGGGKGSNTVIQRNITIKTDTTTNNDLLINEIYGGSELGTVNTNGVTNITINGGNITQVFGGGKGDNSTSPVNNGNITVNMKNGDVENIFGGNNIRGVIKTKLEVNVTGGTVSNVYGGSDGSLLMLGTAPSTEGIVGATNTNVNVSGGKIESAVYGGGKKAVTSGTSIVNISGGEFATLDADGNVALGTNPAEVFGGGKAAKVNETQVNILSDAKLYNVYGGSDESGLVTKANVNSEAGEVLCNTYGGGKIAEVTTANSYLKGTKYSYKLKENETAYINTCGNAFGGGANADVETANIILLGSSLLNVYGGSNEGGVVKKTNVLIRDGHTENVFGGNNQGGSTVNSYVDVNNNMVLNIDTNGDGNIDYNIDTNRDGKPDLNIDKNNDKVVDISVDFDGNGVNDTKGTFTVKNVFGGSNGLGASIDETTTTNIRGGVVSGDVFGGGNQAKVVGSTYVNMYSGTVENLYGGGNRSYVGDAIVNDLGVFVSGNTPGSTHVNVVDGTINENVYGSSNASFIYGTTSIKIGNYALDALGIRDSVERNILIDGSVFAGSETNVDKSTTYDDSYEGVTGPAGSGTGLVEISGTSYVKNDVSTLQIHGSIYGSGNNSKVVNGSNIYIANYGTKANPVTSTSIQRATNVYITDSHVELNGAVDRADPNSYRYSLIRLDKLYILGSDETKGTYLYLRNGSTFLKGLSSGTMAGGSFTPQKVTDNGGKLEVSVADNRIYMLAGKVLSVSDSAAPLYDTTTTKARPVTGMAFLGMYTREVGKKFVRGIYDYSYSNGDAYDSAKTGSIASSEYTFVYGLNLTDYTMDEQIRTHGFYTNAVSEEIEIPVDGTPLSFQYVGVTPANETTLYYKWLIGVEPVEIVVDLIADKYSESGAVNALITKEELQEVITNADGSQTKQEWRDAIMTIQSVNTTGFGATSSDATRAFDGILVDKSEIPTINTDDKNGDGVVDANNYFALSMGTTSSGWLDNYKTNFYDKDYALSEESFCNTANGNCTGNQVYLYDSTTKQRNLSFWLYHSKNLDFSYVDKTDDPSNMLISMNQVKIDVEFRNPHGDPTSTDSTQPVTIVVNISLSDGELDKYGGVIAPGKQYEMFQGRPTTIASNGSFSIYQSLSLDLTKTIAGSATGEKWDVGKIYHKDKTVEITNAYGQTRLVDWSESYRYLASSYLLPVGTVITMLDLKNNEQYYYEVTAENYAAKQGEFNGKNEYKYFLEDFIRMGSTTGNSKFDDDMNEENSQKYYYRDDNSKLAVEEFIFNVDFAGADVEIKNPTGDSHYFFLQLARKEFDEEKVIVSTNGSPRDEMIYTLKPLVSSTIATDGGYVQDDGSVTKETTIYVGESTELELETSLIQQDNDGNVLVGISDTVFDDYKLGAKITVKRPKLDADNNVMHDPSGNVIYEDLTNDLFGTVMEINGQIYYPQTDGSTRIELAGRITDVISKITIDFANSGLTYGKYILVVETFVSYDGLYYGDFEPTYNEFPFELLNNQYGLDVKTETTTQVTHDVNTGEDATGNREIHYILDAVNGLGNPNLKISLERRDYSSTYGTSYQMIPLTNLVEEIRFGNSTTNIISAADSCHLAATGGECYIYNLGNITNSNTRKEYDIVLKLKNGPSASDLGTNKPNAKWKSGTYRVVYTLYDGDVEVGSVYEYLIIRSLNVDEIVIEGSGS